PFPAVVVQVDSSDVFSPDGRPVELVAADPRRLARVIRWGPWPDDPRPKLARLAQPSGRVLPAIASPDLPQIDTVVDQGVRIPIRIVARTPFPGLSAGRPALLVSGRALAAVARVYGIAAI